MRPRHIDTVDVSQLPLSERSELERHRKASFKEIFQNRAWGRNPKVSFSASGMATKMVKNGLFLKIVLTTICSRQAFRVKLFSALSRIQMVFERCLV